MKHRSFASRITGSSLCVVLLLGALLVPAGEPGAQSRSTPTGQDEYGLTGADRAEFNTSMKAYFQEEKIEALFFMAAGIGAIAFAVWSLMGDSRLRKGMAWPFIAIALIQLTVGATVFFRTDAQLEELTVLFYKNAAAYIEQELPRMEVVNYWFDVYRWIEIALIGLGAGLMLFARSRARQLLMGIGLGLMIQSGLMLALDFVAEARADEYTRRIKVIKKVVDANTADDKAGRPGLPAKGQSK